jgi:hypothetical protein
VKTHSCLTESDRSVCSTVACSPKSAILASYAVQSPANRTMGKVSARCLSVYSVRIMGCLKTSRAV